MLCVVNAFVCVLVGVVCVVDALECALLGVVYVAVLCGAVARVTVAYVAAVCVWHRLCQVCVEVSPADSCLDLCSTELIMELRVIDFRGFCAADKNVAIIVWPSRVWS